jgi:4-carboxymuconolactone decarboxylase
LTLLKWLLGYKVTRSYPVARILLPTPETMTPEQRSVYEKIIAGSREAFSGPLRAALHCPELADRWQNLGALLRYQTSLPTRLSELAILVTARRWNSQLEWFVHADAARKATLPEPIIAAIRQGHSPEFEDPDEAAVYEYAREIQGSGQVSESVYAKVLAKLGIAGIVELTALIGYYTMVSMTLNAHEIPLPDGAQALLMPVASPARSPSGNQIRLTVLSSARVRDGAASAES